MSDEIIELYRYIGELHEKIQQLMIYKDHYGIRSEAKEKLAKCMALILKDDGAFNITHTSIHDYAVKAGVVFCDGPNEFLELAPGIKEAVEELLK